jgi:hypothetical protein
LSVSAPTRMVDRRATRLQPWQLGLSVLAYLASAAAGFVLGFGFAQSAGGGAVMGAAAGLNGALFCTLLADWLLARLFRR